MRRVLFIAAVVCVATAVPVGSARADLVMHTANVLAGNQAFSSVGLKFDVGAGPGIKVLSLGIYDSQQNGIGGGATLSTLIFDAGKNVLAQMSFTGADPGTLDGAYRFKSLATPLVLTPGRYAIVGYGFNLGSNNEYNANNNHQTGWPTFNGGGLISFVDSVWGTGADAPPTYPIYSGSASQYGVHDFFDGPNMRFEVVPVPGAVLLGMLGLGAAGLRLRRVA